MQKRESGKRTKIKENKKNATRKEKTVENNKDVQKINGRLRKHVKK